MNTDVRSWVDPDDTWLQRAIDDRLDQLAGPDAYDQAAAVGMILRLRRPLESDELKALLNGDAGQLARSTRELAWARALRAKQLREIEDLAHGEARVVENELHELFEPGALRDASWRQRLLLLARRRDVLEGVATLLEAAGAGERLASSLSRLDAWGSSAVVALVPFVVHDEYLRRAKLLEPEAWWTSVVSHE